ncbi:MAG: hypothetical protein D6B28_11695 [Gammaproteobacteria bacterium]|nr:MAG: hypothetical protein D6B28_11695 [Gammaproteobacteria bacterium]
MSKVFVVPFHVKRMAQSIMPPELSGAYVTCYVASSDYSEATEKSLRKLLEDGLHPEEVLEPIYEMNSDDWTQHVSENWNDYIASMLTQAEFEIAMKNGEVVYGPFGSYA